MTRGLGRWER